MAEPGAALASERAILVNNRHRMALTCRCQQKIGKNFALDHPSLCFLLSYTPRCSKQRTYSEQMLAATNV
ncbi:hypothetical protein [Novosphingobium sp.]|uniref:hypothetical protein n=1 Tax=Novosphingobium sp. TaxID=1874826 RepID=UPI0025D9D69A|nr:hypothetical protein [Novosphingobium sp.]